MQTPLELVFQNVEPSDEVKTLVDQKARHLETFFDGMTACKVYVRAPHKRHKTGNLYEVTIEVRVPGDTLVVRHNQTDVGQHEHIQVAVRDAFATMAREVKRWKDKIGGDVKTHDTPLQGTVTEIYHDAGYGQIMATDHRLVYFHENSVVGGGFGDLERDDTVELVVETEESETGPQASTVRKIGGMAFDPKAKRPH
ncbi:HPF/RaiA family ribosome-associated protein [Aestuariicoccus sp. MJ-SS9]|uniref:HPF/RaiA family ribosome-associated protein n=1 Tax=Aestuariicoccus sp. MJ-SS9 TaxID=3079855 RepID=UPI0029076BED|nr:HPF/RaiA family ribosome-associated protein [Aestuariicoccus sp. MJ-SS9]MDU8913378.1 HPF/RaiA family ribosome-associated protein [Aestuariicoccus sp. MJ-SS9]